MLYYLRVNNVYLYSFLLLISQQIFIEREILNTTTLLLTYTPPFILFMRIYIQTKPTNCAIFPFVEEDKSPFKCRYLFRRHYAYSPQFSPYHAISALFGSFRLIARVSLFIKSYS